MSFATVADYEAKYGAVDDADVLQVWLDDATAYLTALMGTRLDDGDSAQAGALAMVCRDMVHRAFGTAAPGVGVKGYSQGGNGFTESYEFANPAGDFYLRRQERELLGIGGSSVGFLTPAAAPAPAGGGA